MHRKICWVCQAGMGDVHECYDFTASASWRTTLLSQQRVWEESARESRFVSAIWEFPGFHLSFLRPDWMHMVDLGTLQYLQGNLLWDAFQEVGGVFSRPKAACGKLESLMNMCASRLGLEKPFHSLAVTMIRPSLAKKPKLKLKAAEGRHLLPILREMLATCFHLRTEHQRMRLQCTDALLECYKVMDEWESCASPSLDLALAGRRFLLLCRSLCDSSADPRRWHMYPKHHMVVHLVEGATANPRDEWNYGDESEIGCAVKLARKTSFKYMCVALMARYRNTFVL